MAAQRFPDDWDGVLAGAPALAWTEQLSAFARIQQALRRPGALIPASQLPGVAAGRAVLSEPQAAALAEIVKDFDPRYAAVPGGWDQWIVNPDRGAQSQLTFAEQFFGNVVLNRPGWRVEDLTPADLAKARALSPTLDAAGDLSRFRRRGGKLVIYMGMADPVISPRRVLAYHRASGAPDFSRLYRIPGMLHCQGGAEPDAFGQSPVSPPLKPDPRHDIRAALEAWVEARRPPGTITTALYRNGKITKTAVIRPD
jgi:feruloyl esterase